MAAYNKFNSTIGALGTKQHNFATEQMALFLTNTAPAASNTQLSDISQISYTNISSRNITTTSWSQTSGVWKLVLADLTISASGSAGPFRYYGVYNANSAGNLLIAWYDSGSSVNLASGDSLVIDFDGTNGLLTIG